MTFEEALRAMKDEHAKVRRPIWKTAFIEVRDNKLIIGRNGSDKRYYIGSVDALCIMSTDWEVI